MSRFRVLMNRHHLTYNPGETPVLSAPVARAVLAAGAGEVVEELPDEPIHGHPTGGAVAAEGEAQTAIEVLSVHKGRLTWRNTDDPAVVAAINDTLADLGRHDLMDDDGDDVPDDVGSPITPGIMGAPIGGNEPPAPATQADVEASLGQNRAHKPNERRSRAEKRADAKAAKEAELKAAAEATTPPPADVDPTATTALDPILGGGDTAPAGGASAADVDPFAGAES